MNMSYSKILSDILDYTRTPRLFEPGEKHMWDDDHISKGMLEAHLNPDNDLASRRHSSIEKEARYLSTTLFKKGNKILDLGCGPGLYSSKLAERGMVVTGIDISERSLNYAKRFAAENNLDIDYQHMDFFDMDFAGEFDAVLQAHGEMCTFSDEERDRLLAKIRKALKHNGTFVCDLTMRGFRLKSGAKNHWYISDGGFWRPGKHLVLEQGFDYPENDVWLDQYVVIDEKSTTIYRTWIHEYTLSTWGPVLEKAGFQIEHIWNDLCGTPYSENGDWIAIVGKKVEE
jgi:SAM-dependent methyltransferase